MADTNQRHAAQHGRSHTSILNYWQSLNPECFFQITTDFDRAAFFSVPHFSDRPPGKGVPGAGAGGRF